MSLPVSEALRTSLPVIFSAAYDDPPRAMNSAKVATTLA